MSIERYAYAGAYITTTPSTKIGVGEVELLWIANPEPHTRGSEGREVWVPHADGDWGSTVLVTSTDFSVTDIRGGKYSVAALLEHAATDIERWREAGAEVGTGFGLVVFCN